MRRLQIVLILLCAAAFAGLSAGQFPPPPGGPFGPPPRFRLPPRPITQRAVTPRPDRLKVDLKEPPEGLVKNPRFTKKGNNKLTPADYTLAGDATWVFCGDEHEYTDAGIALDPGPNSKGRGERSGSVSQRVTGFESGFGRWFRFTFRGLAEPNFSVANDQLYMRVGYFGNKGANSLDSVTQFIYQYVESDRKALAVNGDYFKNGGAAWKTYSFEFRLPFAEIDTMDLSVGFKQGNATAAKDAAFYVTEFSLEPIAAPADAPKISSAAKSQKENVVVELKSLVHLGGRWYYKPDSPTEERPKTVVITAKNADRLFYTDGRLSNPFAENMTAWLRKGFLDLKGTRVEKEQFVPDNVVLEFVDGKELVVHTRNLPNHPTAKFPDTGGLRNPNSIQEKDATYYLPIEPVRNPRAIAMDKTNSNRALPGGPIAFAINGVAFYNPFDAEGMEAVNIMDRCCGHPSPDNRYHYHKYPVCVKSPFADFGQEHSPLIGFALDGFPIYGPYVAKGLMAKDDKEHPLDAFNMRFDEDRGWHYQVTPGKFPYVIGGFAGTVDPRNLRRGPPR